MATAQPTPSRPSHHMVFTIPRTASHLLLKLLNLSEQVSLHRHGNGLDGYIFLPAAAPRFRHSLPGKPIQEWIEQEKTSFRDVMQSSFNDWSRLIQEAERQGKSTFVKEHLHWMVSPIAEARLYGNGKNGASTAAQFQVDWKIAQPSDGGEEDNITCLPDGFLLQHIKPTFLIRHPALTVPSSVRAAIDKEGVSAVLDEEKIQQWECTYCWSLALYKFYTKSAASSNRRSFIDGVDFPIVLDAQDLGDEALVKKYARAIGLEEDKVRFSWQAADQKELGSLGSMERRMKSTILASSGIDGGKLNSEDIYIRRL